MNFRELEKFIVADGWILKKVKGSHYHYVHKVKSGKVTIPKHSGDIQKTTLNSILKQAGLK